MSRRLARWIVTGALAVLVAPLLAPELLAFPYRATSHGYDVWSERPLPADQLDRVAGRAAALVAASPIARKDERRAVFLTEGGWRWTWLAAQSRRAFGVTRAVGGALLINRSNLANDRVFNASGRARSLSGVIAHETCHGMQRRRYGVIRSDIQAPQWLREGYCDYVAQESTLTDAEVAKLKAERRSSPALVYYEGHKRVAAELAHNGGNVDALFAAN